MLSILGARDFSRGLDLRSSLVDIQPGFTPNARNFQLNEAGGIEKVLGYSALTTLASVAHSLFSFRKSDASFENLVAVCDNGDIYGITSAGTATKLNSAGRSACTRATFAVRADVLYIADGVNALTSWSGSGNTATVSGSPPLGQILGTWNDVLWLATTTNMNVAWSDAGDFASWPVGSTVTLGGPGTQATIKGGAVTDDRMIVFTDTSTHAISSVTGTNQITDASSGIVNGRSIALIDGYVYGVNRRGIFRTRGFAPNEYVSEFIEPAFRFLQVDNSCAAGIKHRLLTCARIGSTNDLMLEGNTMLEKHSQVPWMAHDYPAYAMATTTIFGDTAETVCFIDARDRTRIRRGFDGGQFMTAASVAADISCSYETAAFDMGDPAHLKRLFKVRADGLGAVTVAVRTDLNQYDAISSLLTGLNGIASSSSSTLVWGSKNWDASSWAGWQAQVGFARVSARARRFTLVFRESSPLTTIARTSLGQEARQIGDAAIYMVEPHYAPLGREL